MTLDFDKAGLSYATKKKKVDGKDKVAEQNQDDSLPPVV